jgi:hypothetical protein
MIPKHWQISDHTQPADAFISLYPNQQNCLPKPSRACRPPSCVIMPFGAQSRFHHSVFRLSVLLSVPLKISNLAESDL